MNSAEDWAKMVVDRSDQRKLLESGPAGPADSRKDRHGNGDSTRRRGSANVVTRCLDSEFRLHGECQKRHIYRASRRTDERFRRGTRLRRGLPGRAFGEVSPIPRPQFPILVRHRSIAPLFRRWTFSVLKRLVTSGGDILILGIDAVATIRSENTGDAAEHGGLMSLAGTGMRRAICNGKMFCDATVRHQIG